MSNPVHKRPRLEEPKKERFELIIVFSDKHKALSTVEADTKEEAYLIARKKYSHKTIESIDFIEKPKVNPFRVVY